MKFIELGKIAEFINGYAFKPTDWSNTGVKIVRIQNLTSGEKSFNRTTKSVPDKYLIRKGDILVSWSATLDVFEWYEEENALLNQHIFLVKPFPDLIGKKYFKYVLGYSIAEMSNFTHGSTMKHIVRKDFLKHKIPLPSIEKQQHIVKILDLAQSLIEKRKQAIAYLDDYIKAVFLDMFGDPVSNPKGWEERNLGDLTSLITDGKHGDCENSENSGYYFISAKDIHNGIIDYSKARQIKKEDFEEVHRRTNLKHGDLVMVNTGATIGKMAIALDDFRTQNTTFQKSVAVIKLNVILLNNNYLKFLLTFKLIYVVKSLSGSAQQNLLLSQIRRIPILTPPIELQINFDKIVRETETLKQKMQSQLKELENNFQAQLRRAFRGD